MMGCPHVNDNRVTVYIWLPDERNGRTGHVALRTYKGGPAGTGYYVSFYPHSSKQTGVGIGVEKAIYGDCEGFLRSQIDDISTDPKPAEIDLYKLNAEQINLWIETFCSCINAKDKPGYNSYYKWKLMGFDLHDYSKNRNHNCSSLVLGLLKIGGIGYLISDIFSVQEHSNEDAQEKFRKALDISDKEDARFVSWYFGLSDAVMDSARNTICDAITKLSPVVGAAAGLGARAGSVVEQVAEVARSPAVATGAVAAGILCPPVAVAYSLWRAFDIGVNWLTGGTNYETIGKNVGAAAGTHIALTNGQGLFKEAAEQNSVDVQLQKNGSVISPYIVHRLVNHACRHHEEQSIGIPLEQRMRNNEKPPAPSRCI